jgi:hypothetical protein
MTEAPTHVGLHIERFVRQKPSQQFPRRHHPTDLVRAPFAAGQARMCRAQDSFADGIGAGRQVNPINVVPRCHKPAHGPSPSRSIPEIIRCSPVSSTPLRSASAISIVSGDKTSRAVLVTKEWRDILAGHTIWILLLLLSALVGYSYTHAVSL